MQCIGENKRHSLDERKPNRGLKQISQTDLIFTLRWFSPLTFERKATDRRFHGMHRQPTRMYLLGTDKFNHTCDFVFRYLEGR